MGNLVAAQSGSLESRVVHAGRIGAGEKTENAEL